jgi:hypothetical protein
VLGLGLEWNWVLDGAVIRGAVRVGVVWDLVVWCGADHCDEIGGNGWTEDGWGLGVGLVWCVLVA